jgi:hypothetical protein
MSKKTIILLRFGTCLITISLALFLVVSTPNNSPNQPLSDSESVKPQRFWVSYNVYAAITPQQEFDLHYKSDQEVTCYILNGQVWTIANDLNLSGSIETSYDVSHLQAYIARNPGRLLLKTNSTEDTIKYTPTSTVNVSLFFANLSNETALINYSYLYKNTYAPQSRLLETGFATLIIGVIFAIPGTWAVCKKKKNQKLLSSHKLAVISFSQG